MLTLANRGENHHFLCGDVYAPRELLLSEIASGRLKLTPAHQLDFTFYNFSTSHDWSIQLFHYSSKPSIKMFNKRASISDYDSFSRYLIAIHSCRNLRFFLALNISFSDSYFVHSSIVDQVLYSRIAYIVFCSEVWEDDSYYPPESRSGILLRHLSLLKTTKLFHGILKISIVRLRWLN